MGVKHPPWVCPKNKMGEKEKEEGREEREKERRAREKKGVRGRLEMSRA